MHYHESMKESDDPIITANAVLAEVLRRDEVREKNPAAVELGRRGGLKGGPARAAKLSAERRSQIARGAVAERERRRQAKKK